MRVLGGEERGVGGGTNEILNKKELEAMKNECFSSSFSFLPLFCSINRGPARIQSARKNGRDNEVLTFAAEAGTAREGRRDRGDDALVCRRD